MNAKQGAISQTATTNAWGGGLYRSVPLLLSFSSVAFRSLLGLIFHEAPVAAGPPSHANRAVLNNSCAATQTPPPRALKIKNLN